MARTASTLIASIRGAESLESLISILGEAKVLKDPFRERMKRLKAIPAQYGQNVDKWPADVKQEYDVLCQERDQYDALQDEQLKFEANKRL